MRVNSDLIGKYVNIASRARQFLSQAFRRTACLVWTEGLYDSPANLSGFGLAIVASEDIEAAYEQREFGKALRLTMQVIDSVNAEIDSFDALVTRHGSWLKIPQRQQRARRDLRLFNCAHFQGAYNLSCSLCCRNLRKKSRDSCDVNHSTGQWITLPIAIDSFIEPQHEFSTYEHLMTRVEPKQLDALFEPAEAVA